MPNPYSQKVSDFNLPKVTNEGYVQSRVNHSTLSALLMIDNISKFLIEQYSTDFAAWLLGESITLTTINPTELNVEPIRADSVMLLQSSNVILHTEFQTVGDEKMSFRMADYYLRLKRKFPERTIQQVVIY